MEIIHTNSTETAQTLSNKGYEPIECSFGHHGSVVGPLVMDHHGEHSNLEGVALRAYRDHFGARKDDPRFVVTGAADADACFAIASLMGLLPHPSRLDEFQSAPPYVQEAMTADLLVLAEIVNKMDTEPIGTRLEETDEGSLLLLWNQTSGQAQDALGFYAGTALWRNYTSNPPNKLVEAAKLEEQDRVKNARKGLFEKVSEHVALVESPVWGFDVWYAEAAPIMVALTPEGNITVGCRDSETAESLLGPGGLTPLWPTLSPEGWGGRDVIGGSPRGRKMCRNEALAAASVIALAVELFQKGADHLLP